MLNYQSLSRLAARTVLATVTKTKITRVVYIPLTLWTNKMLHLKHIQCVR